MLIGTYSHNMDSKGRVTIPQKFREDLGNSFFLTNGLGDCIYVLSPAQFEAMSKTISDIPISAGVDIKRFFYSGAAEVEVNPQGRVLVPQNLRDYAGLTKEVTVIGVMDHAEIWDTAKWEEYCAKQSSADVSAAMAASGN